jgi:hypothetical protein
VVSAGELGLERRWAEREVEEEMDCREKKSWPRAREGEESGPCGEKVGRRWTGLLVELPLYFPFLFLFQTQTQTY